MNLNKQERQLQILELRLDGDLILREKCRRLSKDEIQTEAIQNLIDDMKHTCDERQYGVGLSANQIGEPLAISIIAIKPTPSRPDLEPYEKICINTEIVETFGESELMWEGCMSTAMDENGEPAMGQVPRFAKIHIKYFDRDGNENDEVVDGFTAHVMQHETDHLNGKLFTDLVGPETLITNKEYRERIRNEVVEEVK